MIIENLPLSGIASFAIADDPAVYNVDESQLNLLPAVSDGTQDDGDEY
jgi:hypothetical protein